MSSVNTEQQQKALVAWANYILKNRDLEIKEFPKDFSDGIMLINMFEILTGKKIARYETKPKLALQRVSNIQNACEHFKNDGVKLLTNPEAIEEGNIKTTLGLLYTIVLRYQIQDKNELVAKLCASLAPYNKEIDKNIVKSLQDGTVLCALVHSRKPESINYETLDKSNPEQLLTLALDVAEKELNVPKLLTAEEIVQNLVDEVTALTYLSIFVSNSPAPEPPKIKDNSEEIQKLKQEIERLNAELQSTKENSENILKQIKETHQQEISRINTENENSTKERVKHFETLLQENSEKMEADLQALDSQIRERDDKISSLQEEIEDLHKSARENMDPDEARRLELERILKEKQLEYENSLAKMKQIEEEKKKLEEELKEAQDRYARDIQRFEEVAKEKAELTNQIEDLKLKLSGEISESDQLKSRLILLTEQQQKASKEEEEILSRRAMSDRSNKETSAILKQLEKEKDEAEKKAKKALEAVEKAKAEQEEVMRKLKKKLEDENRAKLEKKESIRLMKREREALKVQVGKLDSELKKNSEEIKRLRSRRDTYKKKYNKVLMSYKEAPSNKGKLANGGGSNSGTINGRPSSTASLSKSHSANSEGNNNNIKEASSSSSLTKNEVEEHEDSDSDSQEIISNAESTASTTSTSASTSSSGKKQKKDKKDKKKFGLF